jgi:hypothetical protein
MVDYYKKSRPSLAEKNLCPVCRHELIPESYIIREINDFHNKYFVQNVDEEIDIADLASPASTKIEYWICCYECGWEKKIFETTI